MISTLRRIIVCMSFLAASPAGAQTEPLYLMFPHDFLGLGESERRHYVLGVLDARLSRLVTSPKLASTVECITRIGVGGIQRTLETKIIPGIGAAATPMPFAIDLALRKACEHPP